ncbi:Flp family type IVb pilin [Pseudogemmobacter faecipullorum]|uniref:Pilus assembly protein n=1 Tax=Pseudogemmobacter faecipullorum TaxID=2755041 RepID=A0ABS8CP76_9RHOB|nr:hypothetical protein [Pseudogemmobacter faecipullorum]MCB5411197.1 hypothetical protein [Pseudogemmobacter faecipullorum]
MKLMTFVNRFQKDEDGAVTVDWVVLTAAIVGLGLIVMAAVRPSIENLADDIAGEVEKAGNEMKNAGS